MLSLILVACVPCPPCPEYPPTATPVVPTPLAWDVKLDARLDALNVSIDWTGKETQRYWPIAVWMTYDGNWGDVPDWAKPYLTNFPEAGGDHNVFGRCLDQYGNALDKTFLLTWPDGAAGRTPEDSGWANAPIYGGAYYPDAGEVGAYTWEALNGLPVTGIGMPYARHTSYFIVWQEQPGYAGISNVDMDAAR